MKKQETITEEVHDEVVEETIEEVQNERIEEVKMDVPIDVEEKKAPQQESIDILPGVGPATAEKLRESGYETVMSVAVATPGMLVDASGVSESVARKMINAARQVFDMGFVSGLDVLEKRKQVSKVSVGCKVFDDLMGGGFESGAITEAFGEFGSGKTQIGHILAVNTIKQNPDGVVIYIDTENTFRPERIEQLAKGAGLEAEEVLKKIKIARAYNSQ